MSPPLEKQCVAYGDAIRSKVAEFFGPRISELEKMIEEEKAAGRDPSHKEIQGGIAVIDLIKLLVAVNKMKEKGIATAETNQSACMAGAVPDWIGDAQKVSDIALTIAMLPFVLLTGNLAAAHVDLGEVYRGRPLGGDNALIPKARDDVLNALGIGGDVAKLLRDPANVFNDFVSDGAFKLQNEIENFLKKPFG